MPSFKDLLENDPLFQSIIDVTEGKKVDEAEVKGVLGKIEKEEAPKKKKNDDKKAPVTDKEDDGDGLDPVGAEDGDVDNDGDSDDSDKYIKNKRKAIGKAIDKEKEEEKKIAKEDVDKADETPSGDDEEDEGEEKPKKKKKDTKKQDAPKDDAEVSGDAETIDTNPTLDESEMTPDQEKKREEIVKSLKKKKADFVKKYGDRADDVMYATATKMAMKK